MGGYHFRNLCLSVNDLKTKGELLNDNPDLYSQVDNCGEIKIAQCTDPVRHGIFEKLNVGFNGGTYL